MATTNQNGAASAPRPRRRRKSVFRRIVGGIFKTIGTLLLIGICTGAIMACFAVVYVQSIIIPQAEQVIESIDIFDAGLSSTMYYTDKETGELVEMLTLRGSEDREWVDYEDIPQDLVNAAIAIEDKRFRSHQGVDWKRTAYGVLSMFTGRDIQGGSTITQQLIKNLTEYDDVTVKRKILEIFTALEFERRHSKDEILEWYLNYIYLGDGCYGIATAARNYYGKELDDLTLAECASIVSITQNPSLRNPYRNPEGNLYRRNLTLEEMADPENGFISQEECDAAKAEPLNLKRDVGTSREQEVFTWYEDQVINDVKEGLKNTYGISDTAAMNQIYYGGLRIETCFDPDVQAYVDAIYNDRSVMEVDSKTGQKIQSGITVIDNSTGNVVALAGGIGVKEESRIFSRATDTIRPPGSSIKPIAVYAPAIDMGLITPATVFDDVPVTLLDDNGVEVTGEGAEGSAWPSNSYNYFKGLTTVYEALEDSVNTISVRILQDLVTPDLSYQYLTERFGITTLEPGRDVNGTFKSDIDRAPLALGGLTDGVSTYEMAAAYATFANNGMYKEPHTYLKVTAVDINGKETLLLENTNASEAVLKESTVYYVNQMLKNVISWNGTGHDAIFDEVEMTIAGKTGTTTSNKDKWFVGYSPYYTAAVWVGYDIQERIPTNDYLAAEMWKKVMEPLHAGLENIDFKEPENLVKQSYCKDSGMIATEWCNADPRGNRVTSAYFVDGDQPKEYCTVHVPVEVCTESSPILKHDGTESGVYHIAGEYCPEESRKTIGMLDYSRVRVKDSVVTRDDSYMKSTLEALDAAMVDPTNPEIVLGTGSKCDVHTTAPYDPNAFDPAIPSTWPTHDPNFSIFDRTTWPNYKAPFDINDSSTWPTDDPYFDPNIPATWPSNEPEISDDPFYNDPEPEEEDNGGFFFGDWFNNWFN